MPAIFAEEKGYLSSVGRITFIHISKKPTYSGLAEEVGYLNMCRITIFNELVGNPISWGPVIILWTREQAQELRLKSAGSNASYF